MAEAVNEPQRGADSSWMAWVYDNPLLILITFVVLLILRDSMGDLRRRWFAAFANWFNKDVDVKMQELKKDVFAGLSSCESHDPELRKSGGLKILEIGVGTGTNFEFYPEGTKLTVVDPNPHFKQYYNENRKKFPNIQSEEIIVSTGEEMYMVPSNSVDVVVVTLVFCSVTNAQKVLKQILRVLVPGGKFYFFEHIAEFDTARHSLRKRIQSLLTNCGLWPFLFDNCHLTRDFLDELRASGFSTLKAERFHNHITHPIFQLIQPCLKGVAEK
ncbi:thiol S-methyltransferase TMT1A-like isoform X1 [Palaemon carinicauda]|uniref:thiol S-methyltransferase TMT1A-like isoform X1 n=1 Tax=Palaemon carinicauda TaxID=392227 RepID=UPI0035B667EB